jgi:hypothetical protein
MFYEGDGHLRLIGIDNQEPILIQGSPMTHEIELGGPTALMISQGEDSRQVLLLLPGGKGYMAVGSVSGVQTRAMPMFDAVQAQNAVCQQQGGCPPPVNTTIGKPSPVYAVPTLADQVQDLQARLAAAEKQLAALAHHTHTYQDNTAAVSGFINTITLKQILANNTDYYFQAGGPPPTNKPVPNRETSWPH